MVNSLIPWLVAVVFTVVATIVLRGRVSGRAHAIVTAGGAVLAMIFLAIFAGKVGASWEETGSDSIHSRAIDLMKGVVALLALAGVLYEVHRIALRRPIAERWKKLVGVTLGCAGIILYFNAFRFGYHNFYHRHDQYHYYMGAKYFPEIGYDGLYKCTVIAQDQVGPVDVEVDGQKRRFDLRQNVRKPGKVIRNLSGDNLLMKVDDLLADHKICTDRFKNPERWEQFKRDITFFATQAYLSDYWDGMQKDHGYNPPPVWTMAGYALGNLHDADLRYMQFLGFIDILFILGAFACIWWAFGWRGFAVAGVLWGCQASAPYYWTGGAMLRQDWFFFFVLAVCFARKKFMALAAASLVYAALLRIFPGLAVMGWLVVFGAHIIKHRSIKAEHARMLLGGTAAAVVLIGASVAVVGADSYQRFYKHTIEVHDSTPLTNHMGLRVIIGHDVGFDKESGRMKYAKEGAIDPFAKWKQMRNDRYKAYKPVAYTLIAVSFLAFVAVVRRIKSMWIAQCVSQFWIILLSQLTCYYYSFVVISAPLGRAKRTLEAHMFGFAAATQIAFRTVPMNDDKYTLLTIMTLVFCFFLLFSFAPREVPSERGKRGELVAKSGALGQVLNWSAPRLGALVCFVPGFVFAVMGAVKRDVSTVIIGAITMGGGVGLAIWVHRIRLAFNKGRRPPKKPLATRTSPAFSPR